MYGQPFFPASYPMGRPTSPNTATEAGNPVYKHRNESGKPNLQTHPPKQKTQSTNTPTEAGKNPVYKRTHDQARPHGVHRARGLKIRFRCFRR